MFFFDVFLLAIPSHLSQAKLGLLLVALGVFVLTVLERAPRGPGTRRNPEEPGSRTPMTTSHWLKRLGLGRRTQHLVIQCAAWMIADSL